MRRTTEKHPPFHADHVGSLLRPDRLKQARADYVSGQLTHPQLTLVEDEEIRRIVALQKACGMHVITDGELRRSGWHYDFFLHVQGIEGRPDKQLFCASRAQMAARELRVAGPLAFTPDHPYLAHFRFLHQLLENDASVVAKHNLPSPSMLMYRAIRQNAIYADLDAYCNDLVQVYVQALRAFYQAGCRYLQLDDTFWSTFGDTEAMAEEEANGTDPYRLIDCCASILNRIMQDKPEDMYISLHVCQGDLAAGGIRRNGYCDAVAKALGRLQVNSLFLEYADANSGGLEPLREIGKQTVVLGVITSEQGELEDAKKVKRRINDASLYLPLNQLGLSPQCGFSSAEAAGHLTEEQQWNKLRHVVKLAHEIWVMSE